MSNASELDSITEHWRALDLFTNRHRRIRLFVKRLNENQPKNQILFFYGDGGNGKSLLLKYLEKHFLKRFTSDAWEQLRTIEDNDAFARRARDANKDFIVVPYAELNFGIATGGNDQPKQAFFGLLALRRELVRYKVKFPLFDFACASQPH